ncbi:sodium/proline symporter PutP [Paenalcaligenes hominis]|uniref:sodium/proline symporter PutP n=1 Tax=Paenalcaligenes hominis TaxID=643674 RepID=UPI003524EBDB
MDVISTPVIVMFVIYIAAMLLIGWLGYRSTEDLSDYILGGRKLGPFVVALAAGASDMSGWLLMGLPGEVYSTGISASWIAIGLIIGAYFNWLFVAARLRVYTERSGNALTLPDFFSNRFEDNKNILRIVSAIVILVFFTLYCASGVVAGARLFESMFGMSYTTAIWLGAFCTIAYVFIGGFLAVSWTDTIQASLMFTALILTPLIVMHHAGGFGEAVGAAQALNVSSTDLLSDVSKVGIISALAWGLGYFGQPHILVRFMAADSVQSIPRARRIGMTWMILCLAGAVAVGFFGIAYFEAHPEQAAGVTANAERVFIELSILLFNPWIAGILLAAILAAVMSTLSAQLLVCSSSLTQDIYKTFLRRDASDKELVWFGRLMVLAVALIAIALAWNPESRVLSMVSYAWAGFGAAFGPVVILSLVWRRMTLSGALAGMVVGAVVVLLWNHFAWFGLYEIIPGFVLGALAIYVVSLLSPAPAASVTRVFDEVQSEVQKM